MRLSLLLLLGCGEKEALDTAAPDTAPPDTSTPAPTSPWTRYVGWERLIFSDGTLPKGSYNCQLIWDFDSSTPIHDIGAGCQNCLFMFDVTYTLRDDPDVYDDGTCLTGDGSHSGVYGYSPDFSSYGASWVYSHYGRYYRWGSAAWSEPELTYWYGYQDALNDYAYFTNYLYGTAEVTQ